MDTTLSFRCGSSLGRLYICSNIASCLSHAANAGESGPLAPLPHSLKSFVGVQFISAKLTLVLTCGGVFVVTLGDVEVVAVVELDGLLVVHGWMVVEEQVGMVVELVLSEFEVNVVYTFVVVVVVAVVAADVAAVVPDKRFVAFVINLVGGVAGDNNSGTGVLIRVV